MRGVISLIVLIFLSLGNGWAKDGENLFKYKGCAGCHEKTKDSIGPSLATISKAYRGDKKALLRFFRGEAKPIVKPENFKLMEPFQSMLKNMPEKDQNAIADYILSH